MFYFGIPSYKRGEQQDTLKYLVSLGYPKEQIILSVQTKEDYEIYKQYENICTLIYNEGNCVGDNRNNILNYIADGSQVVMLDDDIKYLQQLKNENLENITTKEQLDKFINNAFDYCKKNNARIWGVYPVQNPFFMKKSIDKQNLIIGCVMGLINCFRFDRQYRTKEDYELCCREISKGYNCIRFNHITADAKHKTNLGGCKDDWKYEINKHCADMLIRSYPKLVKRNMKKLDEVRFIGQKRVKNK